MVSSGLLRFNLSLEGLRVKNETVCSPTLSSIDKLEHLIYNHTGPHLNNLSPPPGVFVPNRSIGATLANPALSGANTETHAPEAQRRGVRFKNFFSKTNTFLPRLARSPDPPTPNTSPRTR